jgi:hypothetical protein
MILITQLSFTGVILRDARVRQKVSRGNKRGTYLWGTFWASLLAVTRQRIGTHLASPCWVLPHRPRLRRKHEPVLPLYGLADPRREFLGSHSLPASNSICTISSFPYWTPACRRYPCIPSGMVGFVSALYCRRTTFPKSAAAIE